MKKKKYRAWKVSCRQAHGSGAKHVYFTAEVEQSFWGQYLQFHLNNTVVSKESVQKWCMDSKKLEDLETVNNKKIKLLPFQMEI